MLVKPAPFDGHAKLTVRGASAREKAPGAPTVIAWARALLLARGGEEGEVVARGSRAG
jgi:hypothetical protein